MKPTQSKYRSIVSNPYAQQMNKFRWVFDFVLIHTWNSIVNKIDNVLWHLINFYVTQKAYEFISFNKIAEIL